MGRGHLALACALAVAASAPATAEPARRAAVAWTVVASGSRLGGAEADSALLLRTRAAAAGLSTVVRPGEGERVAAVDLTRYALVVVHAPFHECGWTIRVRSLDRIGARLRVAFAAQAPARGTLVCQALTRAYVVIRVSRAQIVGVSRAVALRAP